MSHDNKQVRFIRKNGKIIPIRANKKGESYLKLQGYKLSKNITRKEAVGSLKDSANYDDRVARTGNKVAAFSAVGALGLGGLSYMKKSAVTGMSAGALGIFALTTKASANGRSVSAKEARQYAKDIKAKRKLSNQTGVGQSSDRRRRQAEFLTRYIK